MFIVDNSDEDWKAVRYLRDWCQLSKSIRLMAEIDRVIDEHSGWPAAFQTAAKA